jgi:hypothetical protein
MLLCFFQTTTATCSSKSYDAYVDVLTDSDADEEDVDLQRALAASLETCSDEANDG